MIQTLPFLLVGCTLPTVCDQTSENHQVLNRFWGRMDQSYAVFDARLGDTAWQTIGAQACESISASSDDDALFEALLDMARELDDGHIQLESDTRGADGWRNVWPDLDREQQSRDVHIASYGPLTNAGLDGIAWGTVSTGERTIGYLELRRLDEFSESGRYRDDRRVFRDAVETAFSELAFVSAWIVDLRFNEGGWDDLGLELAGHFATENHLAWSTSQRNGASHDDFNTPTDTFLDAVGDVRGEVVVLTSGGTFSAGETLVLAMREIPHVTVMGERTSGHLSDLYDGRLPNGWAFTYSGDRYRAADGELYENRGIPPTVELDMQAERLDDSVDSMLEAALLHLTP